MRVSCLIFVLSVGLLGSAHAEKVRTNQTTKVYARAGEQADVLLKVDSGQNMTLIEKEGRWLKVRVKGRTGYVPRSKVDMADDEDIQRNTRRRPFVDGRSRKRGFGSEEGPEDRIGADAVGQGQEDDEKTTKKVAKSKKGEKGEEEEEPRAKKSKKGEDEEEPKAKKKKVEEEPEEEPKSKKKHDDEEESKVEDDVDDSKTAEPEEDKRPTAHVSKKATVYDKPNKESDEAFVVRPTDVLYPIEKKGKWTYVENSEGDSGWVLSDRLEMEEEGGGGKRPHMIDVGAGLGVMFITQQMRTNNSPVSSVPDNYNIPVQAVTLALRGGLLLPVDKKYLLGGDVMYDYANTLFGGVSYDPDGKDGPMPAVVTKLTMHTFNARAVGGYDFGKFAVLARLGLHYRAYLVGDYIDVAKNPARLPQETITAPTLGAALALPHLTDKIGLNVSIDTILFGASVKQTAGLEDGTKASVTAFDIGAGMLYKMNKNFSLQALYNLRLTNIDFGPPLMSSTRMHMGDDVKRSDVFHMLTVGIAKPF